MSETQDDTNLPAKATSPAEKQRARMESLVAAVQGRSAQLKTLLADTGIPFERFVEVFRRALIKGAENPATNLLLADAGSVIQACMDACTAGVLPDGKKGAIVIYNTNVAPRGQPKQWMKKAQFMLMYEGMLQIAYGSGNFSSIMAHVVYETDEWDYELGITPWIKHKPGPRPPRPEGTPAYAVIAAYAVAKTVNGGVFVEVFEPEDIRKVMAVSKATSGPAKDWPEQLSRKGPLRRMWKFLPRDARMDRALEVDEEALLDAEMPEPVPTRKLSPGFAPPPQQQITEGADMVVPEVEEEREFAPIDAGTASESAESGTMEAETPVESPVSPDERAPAPRPVDETPLPPGLDTFALSVKVATSWLNIKQALRTVAKHPAWAEGPQWPDFAYPLAWARFRELEDKTDICQDLILFETWIRAADPMPMAAEANWALLQKMEVFTKAGDDVKGRLEALVKAVVEQGE